MMHGESPLEAGSLSGFFGVLRRRWWVVALCAIVVPAVAVAYSNSQEKRYTGTSSVLLQNSGFAESIADSTQGATTSTGEPDLATAERVASLPIIAARTSEALDGVVTPGEVSSAVSVSTSGQAQVLTFDAEHARPVIAARMANAYAKQYIDYRRHRSVTRLSDARTAVARQLGAVQRQLDGLLDRPAVERNRRQLGLDAVGDTVAPASGRLSTRLADLRERVRTLHQQASRLRERQQELATLSVLQSGDAALVEAAAVPTSPSSPKVERNAIAGAALGLLLGILLAVVLAFLDRRVREPREIEDVYEEPVLGAIPKTSSLKKLGGLRTTPLVVQDAFRMVHDNLRFFNEGPIRSLLITSGSQGDGKTTVAWSVAVAAAEAGSRVLLIEADLRRASLAERLDNDGGLGLSDLLTGSVALSEIIVHKTIHEADPESGAAELKVDIVFAGGRTPNARGLLSSPRMSEVIVEAESNYDLVVIDAPPASIVSDAVPLITQVTGVVVVGRVRRSRRDGARQLREQLRHLRAPLLGVVINGIDPHDGFYGSAYLSARRYSAIK
jgi:polysaccharide biosynthesis transport protein